MRARIAKRITRGTVSPIPSVTLAVALVACGPGSPTASAQDPEAFGRRLAVLITARDTASLAERIEEAYTPDLRDEEGGPEMIARAWIAEGERYGPLAYHSATEEDGLPMLWLRGTRTRAWVGVKLRMEEDAPGGSRIAGVGIRRGTSPPHVEPAPPLPDEALADSLARYMDAMAQDGFFSGVVLVARDGRVVHESAHGLADPVSARTIMPDTRFNIASTGKMFTGVAVARLAQDGRLSLDDPLGAHLPEYPARIADRVTVRDLLTHASGIELDDVASFQEETYGARTVAALVGAQIRVLDTLPAYAEFEPSGEFDYTNEGMNLAGAVVERASGMSYADFLEERVFGPAGMGDTGTDLAASEPPVAVGMTTEGAPDAGAPGPGGRWPNDAFLPAMAMPAGSHYSTVGDLWRFARALADHRLLTPAWTDSVTALQVVEAELPAVTYGYGFGFEVIVRDGLRSYGHAGGMPGASTKFEVYPELDVTIIVLSNWDGTATMITNHIRELTLRR